MVKVLVVEDDAKLSRFLVRVLVEDPDPRRAAVIANTMADEFIAFNLDDKLDTSNSATSKLQAQMEELRGKLQTS